MQESTLAIIKPDAVQKGNVGRILTLIEDGGLEIVALKRLHLSREHARGFYYVHRDRPFFDSLTAFMSEGPIVALVLRAENAILRWRALMGATDPGKASEGTLRELYGEGIERNAVHGSDSPESASFEISYFFPGTDLP